MYGQIFYDKIVSADGAECEEPKQPEKGKKDRDYAYLRVCGTRAIDGDCVALSGAVPAWGALSGVRYYKSVPFAA